MKKVAILFLVLALLFCGCDSISSPPNSTFKEAPAKPVYSSNGVAVSFDEYVLSYTDPDGFSYEVTCKLSPWILQSDTDHLNPTWNSIANGKVIPTIDTWGFIKCGDTYSFSEYYVTTFESQLDDMYYAVGTLSIRNTTNGFSFSSDRIGYPKIQIVKDGLYDYSDKLITRTYAGHEERTSAIAIQVNPKMTSDHWGPIPFVIAYAERHTPNNPDGESYEQAEGLQLYLIHAEATNKDLVPITIRHME